MDAHRCSEHHGSLDSRDGAAGEQPLLSRPVDLDSAAGFYPLVYAGASGKPSSQFCDEGDLDGFDVKGKIVVCELGGDVPRVLKGQVVHNASGAGMILVNQFPQGYDTLADVQVLPASHVDYAAAPAQPSSSTSTPRQTPWHGSCSEVQCSAPSIVFFSSRGPNMQDPGILKPDVTGPGVAVRSRSTFLVTASAGTTYNIISGTSMSTPHLSGIAAFIKSKHPDWSPAAIKSAIMTTADIDDRSGNRLLDEHRSPASFFATGAGHVNPEMAADPGLVYDIAPSDYISYLCGMYTNQEVSVIARRAVNC
jgi:subtilisin family serine protease